MPQDHRFEANAKIITLGSCFAEYLGGHLKELGLQVLSNPTGNIYSPAAFCRILDTALDPKADLSRDLIEKDGVYNHFLFHSKFQALSSAALLEKCNLALDRFREFLKSADLMVCSLGTAYTWYYQNEAVANCHRIDNSCFTRSLGNLQDIKQLLERVFLRLKDYNPKLHLVMTVSPVRHLREAPEDNSLSKAHLRILCDLLCAHQEHISYFPAFEIMLDELRDYRYYDADMVHPSPLAIQYIIDRFGESRFSDRAQSYLKQASALVKDLKHRPMGLNQDTRHLQTMQSRLQKLREAFPEMVYPNSLLSLIPEQFEWPLLDNLDSAPPL
jgi:hypothetical protein